MIKKIASALTIVSAFGFGANSLAQADVISATPNVDLSSPYTLALGNQQASYIFSSSDAGFGGRPIRVTTGGSALVASGTTLFDSSLQPEGMFSNASLGPNDGNTYTDFATPGKISNSSADVYIGLKYRLGDGNHYGYAEVLGYNANIDFTPTLVRYGYQTTPDTAIMTGQRATVPEPSSLAMFAFGLGLAGLAMARRQRARTDAD